MKPNKNETAALSRLFSSTVFHEMAKRGRSNLFARMFSQTGLCQSKSNYLTVREAFDAAFSVLKRSGFRDEYIYRAALIHNILLGRHSLKNASMLTEFRIGACKADLVILNGTGTVYEIKSERDSLSRLENQLQTYRKVFEKTYVISGESHLKSILKIAKYDVGVMCLNNRGYIRIVREAADRNSAICPLAIFESLRSNEARAVLQNLGISVPAVPNTVLRSVMRDRFAKLDPTEAHRQMIVVLKQTRDLSSLGDFVRMLPRSLQPAALSIPVSRTNHFRILDAINTEMSVAINWD